MNNETWQKPTWTRAASAEANAWLVARATGAMPAASDETWQRSWARAASVETNAWREATARPRGATAMTETWRRPGWARGASERAWETSEGLAKDAATWAKEATVGAKGRLEGATKEFAKLVKEAGKRADFSPPVG